MTIRSVGVHDGIFHADEVTACALLSLFDLIDENKIYRTRDPKTLENCEYVCDVGGEYNPQKKRFDHHQIEYRGKLSSAGMILLYLKDENKISSKFYDHLNNTLLLGVDAEDNGIITLPKGVCSFSEVIAGFLPISYQAERSEYDEQFRKAFIFTKNMLERILARYEYNSASLEIVKEEMKKQEKILIFDEPLPWMDSFFSLDGENHPALFVVMPTGGTHWKLRGIPPNLEKKMQVRLPMPQLWAGLHEQELEKQCHIPGAIFCHKGLFISIWGSKKSALLAAKYILEKGV